MSKVKDTASTVVFVYVAAVSVAGLAKLTIETIDYIKERKAKKK